MYTHTHLADVRVIERGINLIEDKKRSGLVAKMQISIKIKKRSHLKSQTASTVYVLHCNNI